MPIITDIIIFNNNPNVDLCELDLKYSKLSIIQSSRDLGLYSRYATAALAKEEVVLFVDDDLVVDESSISALLREQQKDKRRCYGLFGRRVAKKYTRVNIFGSVNIILTRCLLTSKSNCISALHLIPHFAHLEGVPKGNGEDIILSYVPLIRFGTANKAFPLPYTELLDDNGVPQDQNSSQAIHRRSTSHITHRESVIAICENLRFRRNFMRLKRIFLTDGK